MNKQTTSQYKKDTIVRLQLGTNGTSPRWHYSDVLGDWQDAGNGRCWVDALVVATFFERGDYMGWSKEPVAILKFDNVDGEEMLWNMPLESHPWFPKNKLPGFPQPSRDNVIPTCGCGADATYGSENKLHIHYCPKGQMLKALGMI